MALGAPDLVTSIPDAGADPDGARAPSCDLPDGGLALMRLLDYGAMIRRAPAAAAALAVREQNVSLLRRLCGGPVSLATGNLPFNIKRS